jgi:hypothetical protein
LGLTSEESRSDMTTGRSAELTRSKNAMMSAPAAAKMAAEGAHTHTHTRTRTQRYTHTHTHTDDEQERISFNKEIK